MKIVQNFVNCLAQNPTLLDILRRLLEGNHNGERKIIIRELPNRLSQKVLDLGCGTGVFSPFFGPNYTGIDISKKYIEHARRKYNNKTFLVADARMLDFPTHSFDVILINGVLHHMDDKTILEILPEMERVLKPDGQVLVMENVPGKALLAKLVTKLDLGEYIRLPNDYSYLLEKHFNINKTYPIKIGICDYQVFCLSSKLKS